MKGIQVDVTDIETGDHERQTVTDDVIVICAGSHFVDSVTKHANGTQTWTIKRTTDDHEPSTTEPLILQFQWDGPRLAYAVAGDRPDLFPKPAETNAWLDRHDRQLIAAEREPLQRLLDHYGSQNKPIPLNAIRQLLGNEIDHG